MAESGLSLGFTDLKAAVGRLLGYGSVSANWSAAQLAEIVGIVQTGYRRVLYPPSIVEGAAGYQWTFLRPTSTLTITSAAADYSLPDDFGSLVGGFHYAEDVYLPMVQVVPLSTILDARSGSNRTGDPEFVATRFKSSDGSRGQRQEALFYPAPDQTRVLSYSYDAYQGALSDSYPYPLGGMQMSELYKESCLAIVEVDYLDQPGPHFETFKALLADAIARDRKHGARRFGNMGNPSEITTDVFKRGGQLHDGAYSITYKGSYI